MANYSSPYASNALKSAERKKKPTSSPKMVPAKGTSIAKKIGIGIKSVAQPFKSPYGKRNK